MTRANRAGIASKATSTDAHRDSIPKHAWSRVRRGGTAGGNSKSPPVKGAYAWRKASQLAHARKYSAALPHLRRAASVEHGMALYVLGNWHIHGRAVEKHPASAAAYFLRAARAGTVHAQLEVAKCYERGHGLQRDLRAAFHWYSRAARRSAREGAKELGRCHYYGIGTRVSRTKAFRQRLRAARSGSTEAQYDVAFAYEIGNGVRASLARAVVWFEKAAQAGDRDAAAALRSIRRRSGDPRSSGARVVQARGMASSVSARRKRARTD